MATRSPLVPADRRLGPAVAETISALSLTPQDAAAARLAERYAREVDDAEDPAEMLDRLGPKLLSALVQLGATPAARAAVLKGGATGAPNRLDVLRAAGRR